MSELKNSYWRTSEEVNGYLKDIQTTKQYYSSLIVPFTTEMSFIEEMLPPCYDLPEEPKAMVMISTNRSTLLGFYQEARIAFACKANGEDAWYVPVGFDNEEWAAYTTRETRGYGMHHAVMNLQTVGKTAYASIVRHGLGAIERCAGEMLCEIEVEEMSAPAADRVECDMTFTGLFHSLHSKGRDTDFQPLALLNEMKTTSVVYRTGKASLKFFDGTYNRFSEIPVVEVGEAVYCEGVSEEKCKGAYEVPGESKDYLKYYFGVRLESMFDIPLSDFIHDEVKELYDFVD